MARDGKQNVILILADDLGYECLGCYDGKSYKTPNLDGMAERGVRFNHAYSLPLCTPTRVALMTGKYNFRNWKAFGVLDPDEKTFGHYMQDAGMPRALRGNGSCGAITLLTSSRNGVGKGCCLKTPVSTNTSCGTRATQRTRVPDMQIPSS